MQVSATPSCQAFAMFGGFETIMVLHMFWQGAMVWIVSLKGAFLQMPSGSICVMQWRSLFSSTGAEPCPGAEQVLAVRKSGRFAWVEFSTIQAAHQALQLDGEPLGTGMLKISQSKTPIHTAGWRAPVRLLCFVHCLLVFTSRLCRLAHYLQPFGYAPRWAML